MISLFDAAVFCFNKPERFILFGFTATPAQESTEDAKYDSSGGSCNTSIGSAEDDRSTLGIIIPGDVGRRNDGFRCR